MSSDSLNIGIILDNEFISRFDYMVLSQIKIGSGCNIRNIIIIKNYKDILNTKLQKRNYIWEHILKKIAPNFVENIQISKIFRKTHLRTVDAKEIKNQIPKNVDFFLSFSYTSICAEISKSTSISVLKYQFGRIYGFSPTESFNYHLYNKIRLIEIFLLSFTNESVNVLKKGTFKINYSKFKKISSNFTRAVSPWVRLYSQKLKSVENNKNTHQKYYNLKGTIQNKPRFNYQNLGRHLVNIIGDVFNFINEKFYRNMITTRRENWSIGLVNKPIDKVIDDDNFFNDITWLPRQEPHIFWADPFGLEYENTRYIFFEQFNHYTEKGTLHYVTYDQNDGFSQPTKILESDNHLSYPYPINHNGDIYIIPESSASNNVSIFRAVDFPRKWKKVKTLIPNVRLVDNTLVYIKNKWWLFAYNSQDTGLHLYYADDLLGDWTAHFQNPVKQDIRTTRPAGNIFENDGTLYRPVMDLSESYGSKIHICKIKCLSESEFDEKTVKTLSPKLSWKYNRGMHTLSKLNKKTTLFDARNTIALKISIKKALKKIINKVFS